MITSSAARVIDTEVETLRVDVLSTMRREIVPECYWEIYIIKIYF